MSNDYFEERFIEKTFQEEILVRIPLDFFNCIIFLRLNK